MKRVLSFILVLCLLMAGAALAQESVLKVSGTGTVYMQADQASAVLGIMLNGEDLAKLQEEANTTVSAVVEALKAAGINEDDISTNRLYISPRYDYSSEIERIIGYSISNSLTIYTEDMDKIGAYIDAAFAAGANTFDSIGFSVKDDGEAQKRALKLAVQDAGEKAQAIAEASGYTLGSVLEINEAAGAAAYYNGASGSAKFDMVESAAAGAGTTVRAAQIEVSANVQITYELK